MPEVLRMEHRIFAAKTGSEHEAWNKADRILLTDG
jgi:hypothetical protein